MKFFRLLISLFFLIVVWAIFIAGREFLLIKPIENLAHVPENATFAMRLDGTALLKSSAFSIILEANDPDLIDVINAQINEKRKRKGKSNNIGIDYLSDMVVYIMPFENGQVIGVTYNISRPDLMRKNASRALDENEVYALNDNVGVVLSYKGEMALNPKQKTQLIELANKIAFQPAKSDLSTKLSNREPNKIIQLSSKGQLFGSTTLFNRSDMDLTLEEHGLKITGQLLKNRYENRVFVQPKYTIPNSGLHFFTTLITDKIQDSIQNILHSFELGLPDIVAISLNFRGLKINNTDKNLIYSPDIDLLLTFKSPVDLREKLFHNSMVLKELKLTTKGNNLTNGVTDYYFSKIDECNYLISSKKSIKTIPVPKEALLSLKGPLEPITNISGDKMILFFLENLPIFRSTKDFFSKTEGIDIEISNDKSQNMALVKGRFSFKDQYYPLNELLKYSIQNNFIRVK